MRVRPWIMLLLTALAGCGSAASPGGSHGEPGGSCMEPKEIQALRRELGAKTHKNYESAVAHAKGMPGYEPITLAATRDLFIPELTCGYPTPDRPPPTMLVKGPERGLLEGEVIVATAAAENTPSKIMFGTTVCFQGHPCDCFLHPVYHFASAPGGRVAIIRLSPQLHDVTVVECSPCTFSCGMPSPRKNPTSYALPVDDVSKVDIIHVPYEVHRLDVQCEHMISEP